MKGNGSTVTILYILDKQELLTHYTTMGNIIMILYIPM